MMAKQNSLIGNYFKNLGSELAFYYINCETQVPFAFESL